MASRKKMAVLVAERDGDWSEWIDSLRADVDDIAIVLQRMDESPAQLAFRVRSRVESLAGAELVTAALVGGDRWDAETLSARSLMIRAIVSQMVSTGTGRLFLDAGTHARRGQHAMQALASVVEDQLLDTGVDVRTMRGPTPAVVRRAA